jgi:hypothetical protein
MADGESRVPLVIGVTGHRDLLDEEQLIIKERVRAFFTDLTRRFPDLPLMVMTPLAEGADRLAAEVAHELNIPTVVLLPMPEDLYQHDFTGESLDEFQYMRGLGECIELPILPELTEAEVAEPGDGRDMQYAQLGAYLAAHSHILLAIWDGKPSSAPGGTGHVIKFHQHDVIDLIAEGQHRSPIDFTEDESDLVYHVVCSRREDGSPLEGLNPGDAWWFTRNDADPRTSTMPVRYHTVFERMAEFSADLAKPVDETTFYPLVPPEVLANCGRGARDLDFLYHRADYLARRYQLFFYREIRWMSALALIGGFSFAAYADLSNLEFMIFPYVFCFAGVLGLAYLDRRFAWQRKFLDYRVLAEGLRVQFYWALAGVEMENPSRFSHDSFLQRQDLELGWIRNVMRYAGFRADSTDRSIRDGDIELAITYWVKPQLDYYSDKARDRAGRHRITGSITVTSFAIMLLLAFALALFRDLVSLPETLIIAMMGLLPFVIAAQQNYAFRMAEPELLAQYQHMVRILNNAIGALQKAPTVRLKCDILRALGEAALEEQGQWLLRQRERPTAPTQLQG